MSADDDDVEIVHLQKGAVRIILPPAGFDRQHEDASTDDFSLLRPLSSPSAHYTIILPTNPNAHVSSSGRGASGNETVSKPLVLVPQKTASDRFSHQSTTMDAVQSKTEAQDSFHGAQGQMLNLLSSEHKKKKGVGVSIYSSQYKQDSTRRRTEEKGMKEKKSGKYITTPSHSDESSVPAKDDQKIGDGGVETKASKRNYHRKYNTFNGILDQRKQTTVTTLPTGATRIVLKHSVLQKERENDYQHSLDSETTMTAEDTRQSIDPNNNQTEDEGFLFSHLTFDCLEDVQLSSENEEQITHLLLTADRSEIEEDLQNFDYDTEWKQSNQSDRICPTTGSDDSEFAHHFDSETNRNILTGSLKHGQRLADISERIPEERYSPFTESASKSEQIFPTPRERLSSDQKTKQVEGRISPGESEDTGNSGGVDTEENSDSECVFSGHTYSRAMWRSTSAEASHLNPSFSSRTPLHEAFCRPERERSGSTSSYEEWRQSSSFFSVLPWAGKTPRMRTKGKRISGETEHASFQSAKIESHQNQMQMAEKSDTDDKNAGRYLEATLALAESEQVKSKSSSGHISGEMGLKDLKSETSDRPKHVQKRKMAITEGNQILFVIPNSKTHPAESTHTISEAAEAEEDRYPSADKEYTLNTNSTGRKERHMHPIDLRFSHVTSLPSHSSQSSSELSSSDSQRSASVTPVEKGELESSSTSSADSVHTVYFVPEKNASVDTSLIESAKRPQISQTTIQKSLAVHSSSGAEVSDVDERSRKKRRLRLTGTQQGSVPPQAIAQPQDRNHLWEKHYKGKTKPTVGKGSQRLPFVDEEDKPKPARSEHASFDHSRKSGKEMHDKADTAASDTASILSYSKTRALESHQAQVTRTSSLSSNPETLSVSGSTIQDSDTGQKTSRHSYSSSNDLLTSESEIGPLVSFPRKTVWGGTVLSSAGRLENEAAMEEENVTAVEIRRRYSAEEYVPASPFASHLKRRPSNLSDGASPLFLQRQRSRSRSSVRQVSLDIGEEWESVQSPSVSLPPMSPVSPLAEDESVFFGPSTSFEQRKKSSIREYIPLEEMTSDSVSKYSSFRKKAHQTSAKLRMLYPNPADPRCFTMSEDEQQSLMSTLTRSELSRLQQAGSPLLRLLKGPKKDSLHKVKKIRTRQERSEDSPQSASTVAMEHAEIAPIEIDPRSDKPIVTVQPMPQIQQEPGGHASPAADSRGGDVAIAMSSSDVRMENMKTLPPYKRRLLPNPFNRLNQRCHSTLQCPCCFFFCFLCCSPALVLMKWSDYEFDYGSWEKARTYGRRTTVLYVIGAVVAVCFVVSSIVATVIFLQESLLRRRGWS